MAHMVTLLSAGEGLQALGSIGQLDGIKLERCHRIDPRAYLTGILEQLVPEEELDPAAELLDSILP